MTGEARDNSKNCIINLNICATEGKLLKNPTCGSLKQRNCGCLSPLELLSQNTIGRVAYQQHKLISNGSRGWKSRIKVPACFGSGEDANCPLLGGGSHSGLSHGSSAGQL